MAKLQAGSLHLNLSEYDATDSAVFVGPDDVTFVEMPGDISLTLEAESPEVLRSWLTEMAVGLEQAISKREPAS